MRKQAILGAAAIGAASYLAVFLVEFMLLIAAGLPLSIAETRDPTVIHSRVVQVWQAYHMFFHHQGEWLPILLLVAAVAGGVVGASRRSARGVIRSAAPP